MSIQTFKVELTNHNKPLKAYLATPTGGGPGLLVLPSWWGLKPYFKKVCDMLAEEGFSALAPDYYTGRVALTIEEAKSLQSEVEGDLEIMASIVTAAKDHLTSLCPGKPIGVIGFSMGTDWVLWAAAHDPHITATVLFYGGYIIDSLSTTSRLMGHFAEHDEWQPVDVVKEFEQRLKAAGVESAVHIYPGTGHWFMEEDRPEYNPTAASLAWKRTLEFLKQTLP